MNNKETLLQEFVVISDNGYDVGHRDRFIESYLFIQPYLKENARILEVGGKSNFSRFIESKHPTIKVDSTTTDLRYILPIASEQYDLVLNMEVFEHINVASDCDMHEFDNSTVKTFLYECNRVLKPGGVLFLTTPNAHSLLLLNSILTCQPGMFYRRHVREYSCDEMIAFVTDAGFKIEQFDTKDVWNCLPREKFTWLFNFAKSSGCKVDWMREDIFILAKKLCSTNI